MKFIIFVFVGSQNDSSVFTKSAFGRALIKNELDLPHDRNLPGSDLCMPVWCVADQAFPLSRRIMRPYAGQNLAEEKRVFNYRLSRARRVIENTFGILSTRWQIFQMRLQAQPEVVKKYVQACICLHNFIMKTSVEGTSQYCPPGYVDREAENGGVVHGDWRQQPADTPLLQVMGRIGTNNPGRATINLRESLCAFLNGPIGQVPWQVDRVTEGWECKYIG